MFRKTFSVLTLAVLMFVGSNAIGQITEIGKVNKQITYSPYDSVLHNYRIYFRIQTESIYDPETGEYSEGETTEKGDCKVNLYDTDLNLIKSIDFKPLLKSINGKLTEADFDILCVGKNLYTNSGKYEFIIDGYINDKGEDAASLSGIFNEDGELVYQLPRLYFRDNKVFTFPFIQNGKLFILCYDTIGTDKYGYPEVNYITKAYQLTGSKASSITPVQNAKMSKLYPNPARNNVTLEYDIQGQMQEMQILDMQGRVIENYLLDPSQKQIKINTSSYKKGAYIYRYGNQSGKFIVR